MVRLRSRQPVSCERENPFKHGLQRGPGVRARGSERKECNPTTPFGCRGNSSYLPISEYMLLRGFNIQNQVTGKS